MLTSIVYRSLYRCRQVYPLFYLGMYFEAAALACKVHSVLIWPCLSMSGWIWPLNSRHSRHNNDNLQDITPETKDFSM